MAGNTIGKIFRLTSFGESHGTAVGGVVDGCPSGLDFDVEFIQNEVNRRKTGSSPAASGRIEEDKVEILSGVFEGKTTGTPIAFLIKNKDAHSEDYENLKDVYRPSHADFTYEKKYGIRDYRGGGRASARETVVRIVGGAIAKLILFQKGIEILAFVAQIGTVKIENEIEKLSFNTVENSEVRCPDPEASEKMIKLIEDLKEEGDSTGGIVTCLINDCPAGIGEPVFDKLHADLGKAMLSINAVKGFEYGLGFESAAMKASVINDVFEYIDGEIVTKTNYSGGIQGGISNGSVIYFNVAFKPVPTISLEQNTVDKNGKPIKLKAEGRHDICVVPRAVPIVEAMAALVLVDHYLRE
ncbi:MAG: chorismate synthase [Bacteroidales bacterium]|nr:chorismate synthase [Bacteroidales bacterium]